VTPDRSLVTLGAGHAATLVFASSASVLVLEILAGRLLAPFAGVTLETFTAIIGTILGGIALGSWMGGRLADRYEPRRLLGPEMAAGGLLALTMPPLIQLLGPALAREPVGLVVVVAVASLPAAAVLSAVTPTAVKMRLRALDETGSVVGRLSAIGTAGAIAGTFVTGFVLVAQLPSTAIVVGVGVALTVWGAVIWWGTGGGIVAGAAVLVAVAAGGLALLAGVRCDVETAYYCVRVEADPERAGGRSLWLDTLRHAYVDLDDPGHLEFAYTRMFAAVLDAATDGPVDTLHLGGGGLTMPRWLDETRPGSTHVVLELDPGLMEVVVSELGHIPSQGVEVVIGDARLGLDRVVGGEFHRAGGEFHRVGGEFHRAGGESHRGSGEFDVVIGDAFGGIAAPWHLTTREVVEEIAAVTTPGGIYVANIIDRRSMSFLRAEIATFRAVFPHVIALGHGSASPPASTLGTGGNVVVAGSDRPFPVDAIRSGAADLGLEVAVLAGDDLDGYVGDAMVLTDSFAPVDQLFDTP
jgi:spermidine synthase/MFS family permease